MALEKHIPSTAASPAKEGLKTSTASGPAGAGTTRQRSIIYGSVATPIKKPDSDHTHKWTVYVKGFHDEDVSKYVKRVVFRLHESFPNPSRAVETAPFEVTETGWGEFQLNIRIVFQDVNQKPLNLMHHLKLYPTDEANNQLKTSRPVVSEHYEEIIFDPPTDLMAEKLEAELQFCNPKTSPRYAELEKMESEELERIEKAMKQVHEQLAEVLDKIDGFSDPQTRDNGPTPSVDSTRPFDMDIALPVQTPSASVTAPPLKAETASTSLKRARRR